MLRFLLFFAVMCAFWGLAHYYVARRFLKPLQWSEDRKRWLRWGLVAGALLGPITMIGSRPFSDAAFFAPVRWAGYTHMGLFFLVFIGVGLRDIAFALGRLPAKLKSSAEPNLERRAFLTNTTNAGIVGAAAGLGGWGAYDALRAPELVEVEIPLPNLPEAFDGFRIAQLSDVHIGPSLKGDFMEHLVDRVDALQPDMVAITGDLVDGHVELLGHHLESLGRLRAPDGVYFCTGNHEYYWDGEAWCDRVAELGVRVLKNEHEIIQRDGARLLVAGVNDYRADRFNLTSDPQAAKGSTDHDVSLLLAHQPKSAFAAAEAGFDLQISGHTHGGQFFPVSLVVGLVQPFVKGLGHQPRPDGGQMAVYVNRGTGFWGPPMRTGLPGEITLITLRRSA